MRIGITTAQTPQLARSAALRAAAVAAEQIGYSSVWVPRGPLDPVALAAGIAACTARVRVGLFVNGAGRSGALLARSLRTLDHLCEGRLSIAMDMASDASMCPGEIDEVFDALGPPARCGREPSRVFIAGPPTRTFDRVVERADGWVPDGMPVASVGPAWADLCAAAGRHGRDPGTMTLVARATVVLEDEPLDGGRPSYHGSLGQVADDLDLLRWAGAQEIVLDLSDVSSLDQLLDGYARVAEALETRRTGRASAVME